MRSPSERFWEKVHKTESCWEWTGATVRGTYGKFFLRKQFVDGVRRTVLVPAHRWAYEELVGPIAPGLTIDHLCRNKRCVNPEHLEPVTVRENNRRVPRSPVCRAGHPMSGENLTHVDDGGYTVRRCRKCHREASRRAKAGDR